MKTKTIFLAENEVIIAMDLKNILEKNGFRNVITFNNIKSMLDKALKTPPGLIITDIEFKKEDNGIKSVEKIWEKFNIPVIFISGKSTEPYKKKFDKTKCAFLDKPFKEDELIETIFRLLTNYYNLN